MLPTDEQVLHERIKNLQEDLDSIDRGISSLNKCFTDFEKSYLVEHGKVENRTEDAHQKLLEHLKRIERLERSFETLDRMIQPLIQTNKAVIWIGGALGVSVLGLIWSIITGQVVLMFK